MNPIPDISLQDNTGIPGAGRSYTSQLSNPSNPGVKKAGGSVRSEGRTKYFALVLIFC